MERHRLGELAVWTQAASSEPWARVVMCHGLGEHSARHSNTYGFFAANGVDVVRFDFRGCGESGGERQWIERFTDYVDDAETVWRWAREKLPARPTFLFGHSLGGAISIVTAERVQSEAKGLILSAPAFEVGEGVSRVKIALGRLLNRFLPRLRIPSALDLGALSRDPQVAERFRQDTLCCSFNTVRQGNEILDTLAKLPETCRRLHLPVLIAHGDRDRIVGFDGSPRLLEALASRDKTLEVFPGGYHELHNEPEKDAYLALVLKWMQSRA